MAKMPVVKETRIDTSVALGRLFLLALFYWGLVEIASRFGRRIEARLAKFSFAG